MPIATNDLQCSIIPRCWLHSGLFNVTGMCTCLSLYSWSFQPHTDSHWGSIHSNIARQSTWYGGMFMYKHMFFSPLQDTPWWCIFGPRTLKHGFPTAACFQACWIIPAGRLDETFCSTTRAFRCDRAGRANHTARETELREMRLHPPVPRAPLSLALECMRHA